MTEPLRIRRLKVRGLRGCPDAFELMLDCKSLCLLGENGTGKTTLSDAIELWSTGDLAAFHREGCPIAAAIHLDVPHADVEISLERGGAWRRSLTPAGVGGLEPAAGAPGAPVPIVRHSTIAEFMSSPAGEKKRALLKLIGLEDLNDVREPLRRAVGRAKRFAEEADRHVTAERAGVDSQLAGAPLVDYAERRRVLAGLPDAITAASEVAALDLATGPAPSVDRTGAVDELAVALGAVGADPGGDWNRQVADEGAVRAAGMTALLRAAEDHVSADTHTCPVCEQPVVGPELAARLAHRAADLASLRERLETQRDRLGAFRSALVAVLTAVRRLETMAPPAGWPHATALANFAVAIEGHVEDLADALHDTAPCRAAPDLDSLQELLPSIRAAAAATPEDARAAALVDLADLRQKCVRLDAAQRRRRAATAVLAAAHRMLALADEEIERAIGEAIDRLSDRTAEFYGVLTRGAPYTDVRLIYRPARAGQVEFSLTFDRRHQDIAPPQRIMSTSQLDTLGLALMLAHLHVDERTWGTLVLDDVVNSFGAAHRSGLARLLQSRFANWQVVVLTHDRSFREILRALSMKDWRFSEIAAFSPSTGPLLDDADSRVALRRHLDDGMSAVRLAGLARRALEQALSEPLERLQFPTIRFDRQQRYTVYDYLEALRRGFKRRNSALKDLPVLGRIAASSYVVNLGVHERSDPTALTADDLYTLLDDLDELDRALRCGDCNQPVWKVRNGDASSCACAKLAA